jgi:hypothetical protein
MNSTLESNRQPLLLSRDDLQVTSRSWTVNDLVEVFGNDKIDVYVSKNGRFPGGKGPYDATKEKVVTLSIRELVMQIQREMPPIFWEEERYYAYQVPQQHLPKFADNFRVPLCIPTDFHPKTKGALWLGSEGNITPAHTDGVTSNVLVQLLGTKVIRFWSPEKAAELKLNRYGQSHSRQSALSVDIPCPPDFTIQVNLGEGVFIPDGWIHEVTSHGLCASVTFFFVPNEDYNQSFERFFATLRTLTPELRAQVLHLLGWETSILDDVDPKDWSGHGK